MSLTRSAWCLSLCLTVLATSCATEPQVSRVDLSDRRGVYVVAFTEDDDIRATMERQLVDDLTDRGIHAYPSVDDVGNVTDTNPDVLLRHAERLGAAAVVVVNPVNRDGSGAVVQNPRRVSPVHPDLQALYDHARERPGATYDPAREAIVEVNLFLIQDTGTDLFWSGTAWSFEADGAGSAIRELSDQIATEMAQARSRLIGPREASGSP